MPAVELPPLPPVNEQVERLAALDPRVAEAVQARPLTDVPGALVAIRHDAVPATELVQLLNRGGKPGFVVDDMTDLGEFVPVPEVHIPRSPLYLVAGPTRGDELRSWRPAEAFPHLVTQGRSPLTIHEGLSWLVQQPDVLVDNHCFMTIASRRPKPRGGYDARTPALWISGGTGRDGKERRGAPKLGWCWWNNHHTWLGMASCSDRVAAEA